MLQLRDRPLAGEEVELDPQALIEEARRRTRRRRRRGGVATLLVIGAAAVAYVASSGGGGSAIVAETSNRPFVDVRAFADEGELAFLSRGSLWVLDGAAGTLRKLASTTGVEGSQSALESAYNTPISATTPAAPGSPRFSHDGRWLAYVVTAQTWDGRPSRLWIAHADGTDAHAVTKLPVDSLVGWSPTADELAVIVDATGWYPGGEPGQLPVEVELVSPLGTVRRLLAVPTSPSRPGQVESAVWSPNGAELAVSFIDLLPSGGTAVRAYPVSGGKPTTWFSIGARQSLPVGACGSPGGVCDEVIAHLAGWWPGWGLGFWVYADGMTHNNDNTSLELLSAPRAAPRVIAQTLSDGTTDAVASGPDGALAIVAAGSGGRTYTQGKTVETCDPHTRTCTPLPGATVWSGSGYRPHCPRGGCGPLPNPRPGAPDSGVSLDPAWSPGGQRLAYVKAPSTFPIGLGLGWYSAHELYVYDRPTHSTRQIAADDGVSVPAWSRNGGRLLYVSNDGLWLASLDGRPTEIEYPLVPPAQWHDVGNDDLSYYGQIYWSAQFAWWSP